MTVKDIEFERKLLNHTNYKNHYHAYKSMNTIADSADQEIPESVIKVMYRIYSEVINNKGDKENEE